MSAHTRTSGRLSVAIVIVVAALGAAGCGDDSPAPATNSASKDFDITGRWKGTLHQLGLGSFEVDAEIRSLENASANPVSYTVIDCSGTWDYRAREGRSFVFHEVIDSGAGDKCKSEGEVRLTPAGANSVDYVFNGEGIESRGTLQRPR